MSSAGLPQGAEPRLERPGPLRDRVCEALLELILTRALGPGRHLVESELAGHLGVSRQPVREALQRLNTEGRVDLLACPKARSSTNRPTRRPTSCSVRRAGALSASRFPGLPVRRSPVAGRPAGA
ncbi:hypothetical protein GCM10010272_45950 [Streptomyces lateritius]|nr:hypothetical protein GCM10010272_45950 [Streptomyces lateritius]